MMRLRYGENFAGSTQAVQLRRNADARRRHGDVPSGRPCARLGANRGRVQGPADRRLRRLQGRARPDLRAVRAGAVRRVHHRGDVRLPVFRHGDAAGEIAKLLHSVALFPERAHLVGAYSLGKAQRVIALIREAGYDKPIYLHGAMEKITRYYVSRGIELGELRSVRGADKAELAGAIALCPPSAAAGCLDAALSRSGAVLCLRLDAGAGARAPARRRTAAGDLRPCRLGRPDARPSPRPAPRKSG